MPRILSLSTYPVVKPVHGGQRRIDAFARRLTAEGWEFVNAAVYDANHYGGASVSPNDIPLKYVAGKWSDLPFVGDLQAGEFATEYEAYRHFVGLVRRLSPDVIQLEQSFLWPLVKRLRQDGFAADIPMVYSSQNWEAPLKYDILRKSGVTEEKASGVAKAIVEMELEAAAASVAVVAVSATDAERYREADPTKPIFVVPNGVSRPIEPTETEQRVSEIFEHRRYVLFVGSAYPPNLDGFFKLVLSKGLFFCPPEKAIAICGGVAHGIYAYGHYQAMISANGRRVQFFPEPSDGDLEALKRGAHVVLLPIQFGGGSNLKTAEAIASGKWVVATSTALRGFEAFRNARGILVADTPSEFRAAIVKALASPPLQLAPAEIEARETVYWDRCFDGSGYCEFVEQYRKPAQAG